MMTVAHKLHTNAHVIMHAQMLGDTILLLLYIVLLLSNQSHLTSETVTPEVSNYIIVCLIPFTIIIIL